VDARVADTIANLGRQGFAKLAGAASPSIVERLGRAAQRLGAQPAEGWDQAPYWFVGAKWRSAHFAGGTKNAAYYDCLALDAELDAAVEDFLATPAVRELMDGVLGPDYRMWFCQFRWADPGGDEYVLHQDVYGELGLCLYLNDHEDDAGSMVFWPGSHRWPRVLEALPLLLPRWAERELGHVDGKAGDLCAFLNKTWHGRRSAKALGQSRLVFLISFIPPGPIEKGRRLPEDVRQRLGPEVRRVTDHARGRSFGKRRPAHLPFSSAFEEPTAPDTAAGQAEICDYTWGWCRSQAAAAKVPGEADPLWQLMRLLRDLPAHSIVPQSTLAALRADFARRAAERGRGARARDYLEFAAAAWNGDAGSARQALARWRAAARDEVSDCPACELDVLVRFHAEQGEDREALEAARPLLAGEVACPNVPDATWSALLLPLLRQGRQDEAARAHERGFAKVAGKREHIQALGRHLEYLVVRGDLDAARQLFRDNQWILFDHRCDGEQWAFWSGAWQLLQGLRQAGVASVVALDPKSGADGPIATADLAEHFATRLADVAERFDQRNGNTWRAGLLEGLRRRMERAPGAQRRA